MASGTSLLITVLILAGAVATLAMAAAVIERGGSRSSAAAFACGWLLLVFIPVAWGIFGGRTAWYVQAVGAYDFAGAIPFHLGGGVGAVAIVLFIQRRNEDVARPRQLSSLQTALAMVAITVLWIAWLMLMELDLNRYTSTIVTNSAILAGTSLAASLAIERLVNRRNTPTGALIGLITGLAAATASCAFLEPATAAVTGVLAGTIAGGFAFRKRLENLSLAGVIAVTNLVGGTTGLLMVGVLEPGRGFFYSGSIALPVAQITAVAVCIVYCTLVSVPLGLIVGGRQKKSNSEWAIPDSNR
ncbi:MAG: hypothetical protein WED09_14010 [Homoserinimonas sp.]